MDGTFLGIVLGVLGTGLVQMLQHSNEKRRALARRREEKIMDPIFAFLDEVLQYLATSTGGSLKAMTQDF